MSSSITYKRVFFLVVVVGTRQNDLSFMRRIGSVQLHGQASFCQAQARPNLSSSWGLRLGIIITQQPRPSRPPPARSKCLYWLYLSHFSTEWAEILHDCYLGGKDEVCRQNIDPAALQYSMQRCRISNWTITMPFLNLLRWNFSGWLFTWRGSFLKISIFWSPLSPFLSSQ